jgi:hypothetical protein
MRKSRIRLRQFSKTLSCLPWWYRKQSLHMCKALQQYRGTPEIHFKLWGYISYVLGKCRSILNLYCTLMLVNFLFLFISFEKTSKTSTEAPKNLKPLRVYKFNRILTKVNETKAKNILFHV